MKRLIIVLVVLFALISNTSYAVDLNGSWIVKVFDVNNILHSKFSMTLKSVDEANDTYDGSGAKVADLYWSCNDSNQQWGFVDIGNYTFSFFSTFTDDNVLLNRYEGKVVIWDWRGTYPTYQWGRFVMKR